MVLKIQKSGNWRNESNLVVRSDSVAGRGGEITILNYATNTIGNEAALNFGLENSTYSGDLVMHKLGKNNCFECCK